MAVKYGARQVRVMLQNMNLINISLISFRYYIILTVHSCCNHKIVKKMMRKNAH